MASSCTVCRAFSCCCSAPWKSVFLDPNRFTTNMSDNKLSHLIEGHQGTSQKSFAYRTVNKFQKCEHKGGSPHKVCCGSMAGGLCAAAALQPHAWIQPVSYCFIAPLTAAGTTRGDYRNLSNLPPRNWDVIYATTKAASTSILPAVNGIPSQLTHCSSPVHLSRGWWSEELADFTSCHWCYIRLDTERLVSPATGDAGLAQA